MAGQARSWLAVGTAIIVGAALTAVVGLSVRSWLGGSGPRPHSGAGSVAPPRATSRRVALGFRDYDANCVACHGAPGQDRAPWASRMRPTPPDLAQTHPNLDPRAAFTAICRGVGGSGMPAWRAHRSDDQIWNIVLFVRAMPYISPRNYQVLLNTYGPAPAPFALTPDATCLAAK